MKDFLDYIKRLHVKGIIVITSDWSEKTRDWSNEETIEEIVCLESDKPYKMTVRWYFDVRKFSETCYVEKKEEISDQDYQRYVQEYGIKDTAEWWVKYEKQKLIEREIEKALPRCPKCGSVMEKRKGPRDGQFWGCTNYPCRGRKVISKVLEQKLEDLRRQ